MERIIEYTENGIKETVRPNNDIITFRGNLAREIKYINQMQDTYHSGSKTDNFLANMYAEPIDNGYNVKTRDTDELLLTKEWVAESPNIPVESIVEDNYETR